MPCHGDGSGFLIINVLPVSGLASCIHLTDHPPKKRGRGGNTPLTESSVYTLGGVISIFVVEFRTNRCTSQNEAADSCSEIVRGINSSLSLPSPPPSFTHTQTSDSC